MQNSTAKPFGPARIIALALISLTALGLAYLHFSGGDKTVSVPSGARAGQLTLHACHYATNNGSYRPACDAFRSCARRLITDGVDLARYGLVQQVDDLEAARKALGYEHVDLLSESAGTRTAMIYAWRYPKSIHRSVIIAVNPPGNFLWDAKATDEQIGRYAALCAKDDTCHNRTDDLAASVKRTAADVPDHWLFLPIKE